MGGRDGLWRDSGRRKIGSARGGGGETGETASCREVVFLREEGAGGEEGEGERLIY